MGNRPVFWVIFGIFSGKLSHCAGSLFLGFLAWDSILRPLPRLHARKVSFYTPNWVLSCAFFFVGSAGLVLFLRSRTFQTFLLFHLLHKTGTSVFYGDCPWFSPFWIFVSHLFALLAMSVSAVTSSSRTSMAALTLDWPVLWGAAHFRQMTCKWPVRRAPFSCSICGSRVFLSKKRGARSGIDSREMLGMRRRYFGVDGKVPRVRPRNSM